MFGRSMKVTMESVSSADSCLVCQTYHRLRYAPRSCIVLSVFDAQLDENAHTSRGIRATMALMNCIRKSLFEAGLSSKLH